MKLVDNGVCPCGGLLTTAEWVTKTHRKGRTTCPACGRTELKTEEKSPEDTKCDKANKIKLSTELSTGQAFDFKSEK